MAAEAIMALSSHGNTQPFRRKLTSECPAMIGTVPVYDSVIHYQRDLAELTAQDFIDVVRLHAEDGVDFVTLHCGITRKTIEQIRKHKRKMNIVSRGGSLVFAWMSHIYLLFSLVHHRCSRSVGFVYGCALCSVVDEEFGVGVASRNLYFVPSCLAVVRSACIVSHLHARPCRR